MSRLDCATTNNGSDDWSFLMLGKVAPVIQASSSTFPRVHSGITTRPKPSSRKLGSLKARTLPAQLAAAYKAMNIRDDG